MDEYRERGTIRRAIPISSRPVIETQYASMANERRGTLGVAVTALVIAAVASAVIITIMIMNAQQRNSDEDLALERERAAAAEQRALQPAQPPIVVNVPPPVTTPAPDSPQSAPNSGTTISAADVEASVNSKLLDDRDLRPYAMEVKVSGETVTLSGQLPNEELKVRAERVAKTVKGVRSVINNITVQP